MERVLPILFNTEMVRAILDGRKTVTRRCVKFLNGKNPNWTGYVKDGLMLYNGTNESCIKPCQYQPGDILYVRETWCKGLERYLYKANYSNNEKFYKDGKDKNGKPKYRRDCKDCYKATRIHEAEMKKGRSKK